jgi:hypothetical protein
MYIGRQAEMRSHENAKRLCSATLAMILAGVLCIPARSTIAATEEGQAATTTEKQQTDLTVTVYNSNIGLVKDVRQLDLAPGVSSLHFEDVASSIRPETVHLESLTDAAGLSVLEQNYEYDLLSPQKLLAKYVGKEVTTIPPSGWRPKRCCWRIMKGPYGKLAIRS